MKPTFKTKKEKYTLFKNIFCKIPFQYFVAKSLSDTLQKLFQCVIENIKLIYHLCVKFYKQNTFIEFSSPTMEGAYERKYELCFS